MKCNTFMAIVLATMLGGPVATVAAADSKPAAVANIHQNKAGLAGKTITAQGKVVKVNNGIMGRNFIHIQDGSGKAADGSNDLLVTSTQTATVGDQVTISGTVVLNREFGAGYSFPLIIEQATISRK